MHLNPDSHPDHRNIRYARVILLISDGHKCPDHLMSITDILLSCEEITSNKVSAEITLNKVKTSSQI